MALIFSATIFVVSIFLNYKYRINLGLLTSVGAFVVGCFFLDMSMDELRSLIPLKVICPVVGITSFYGFALDNNTIQGVIDRVIYCMRRHAAFVPVSIFALSVFFGILGMDAASITVIMTPFSVMVAEQAKLPQLVNASAAMMGASVGSNYMLSFGGTVLRGILDESGCATDSFSIAQTVFTDHLSLSVLLFFFILLTNRRTATSLCPQKPVPFNHKQRLTVALIFFVVSLTALPSLLSHMLDIGWLSALAKKLDSGSVMLAGAALAALFRLGDFSRVLSKHVPWRTIFMLTGVTMLIGVCTKAGLLDLLGRAISANIADYAIAPLLCAVAGVMSLFSSTVSVVMPTMVPLAVSLAGQTGCAPDVLVSAIVVGASVAGMSPFSVGGSIAVSSCANEETSTRMVYQMLRLVFTLMVLSVLFYSFRQLV